ncbi:MAG: signal peptidase II [Nitrospirae bacterium]|nr:signal peptidase II [Nitrospirota bacterium]
MSINPSAKKYFIISIFVFAADQITKRLIEQKLHLYESIPVTSFFNIVSARNRGSAFGMFQNWGNMPFIVITVIVLVIIAGLLIYGKKDLLPLSLILGGAAGNMTGRITTGSVVDFLDFYAGRYHWPAFNVADMALTCGIGLMIISHFRKS